MEESPDEKFHITVAEIQFLKMLLKREFFVKLLVLSISITHLINLINFSFLILHGTKSFFCRKTKQSVSISQHDTMVVKTFLTYDNLVTWDSSRRVQSFSYNHLSSAPRTLGEGGPKTNRCIRSFYLCFIILPAFVISVSYSPQHHPHSCLTKVTFCLADN